MCDDSIRELVVQPQVNALEKDIGLGYELIAIPEVVEEDEPNRIPISSKRTCTGSVLVLFNGLH